MRAKIQLFKKISDEDNMTARDLLEYLKHTARDEFTTRQELTGKDGENITAVNFVITPIKNK